MTGEKREARQGDWAADKWVGTTWKEFETKRSGREFEQNGRQSLKLWKQLTSSGEEFKSPKRWYGWLKGR